MFNPEIFDEATQAVYKTGNTPWFQIQRLKHDLHPTVHKILYTLKIQPKAWQTLLLEWPHVSETDAKRVAYTRSEEHGLADRQTVTSLGKYLARHWPHVPDHTKRNWLASASPDKFELLSTREDIITAVELGPQSCMQSKSGHFRARWSKTDYKEMLAWQADKTEDEPDWEDHPYAVYNPRYGWRMAVRKHIDINGEENIDGRVLLNTEQEAYVRSYCRPEESGGSSQRDYALEEYVQSLGYIKESEWQNGLKLDYITHGNDVMMPYLDGNTGKVSEAYDKDAQKTCFKIDSDGDYECDNTDGTATHIEKESVGDCHVCGDTILDDGDDYYYTGEGEDELTCRCCISDFTRVRGERGSYYVPDSNAVCVLGRWYDSNGLPSEIVELENGDFARLDDVVSIGGCYYHSDSWEVVSVEEDDEDGYSALRSDCWQDADGGWHRDGVDKVEHEGSYYTQEQYDEMLVKAD